MASGRGGARKRQGPDKRREEEDTTEPEQGDSRSDAVELDADPGEEEGRGEQDNGEHVVVGILVRRLGVIRIPGRLPLEAAALSGCLQPVAGHRERSLRRAWVRKRLRREPGRERRLELVPERGPAEVRRRRE